MVGVPGKFKGCNTCRKRRVKCDQARPHCQKCVDSGRDCEGYERPRIFIVGTTKDRGRCSSHPHRSTLGKKAKKPSTKPTKPNSPSSPGQTEDDGTEARVGNTVTLVLHTKSLALKPSFEPEGDAFVLPTLIHSLPEFNYSKQVPEFSLYAFPFLQSNDNMPMWHQSADNFDDNPRAKKRAYYGNESQESIKLNSHNMLLFVYEQIGLSPDEPGPFKRLLGGTSSTVEQNGASSFQKFPDHQFFSRVYRPFACIDAMTRQKSTFLGNPEWCSVPWEETPKTDMDRLLDIQVLLPGIFERARRLERYPPTLPRQLKAKDLLDNCHRIVKSFDNWYKDLETRAEMSLFTSVEASEFIYTQDQEWRPRHGLDSSFRSRYEFVDTNTALLHVHYWAALSLFYRTMQAVHKCWIEPVPSNQIPVSSNMASANRSYSSGQSSVSHVPSYPSATAAYHSPPNIQLYNELKFEPHQPQQQQPIFAPSTFTTFSTPNFISANYSSAMQPTIPTTSSMYTTQIPEQQSFYNFEEQFLFTTSSSTFHTPSISSFSASPPQFSASHPSPHPSPQPYQDHSFQPYLLSQTPSPNAPSHSPSSSRMPTPTPPPSHSPSAASIGTSSSNPTVLDDRFSDLAILTLANHICQSVPFLLRDCVEVEGPDALAWPLGVAEKVYETQGEGFEFYKLWCVRARGVLAKEGWGFAGRVGRRRWRVAEE